LQWFEDFSNEFGKKTGRILCDPRRNSIKSRTEFANGSKMEIITASNVGFRGAHPNKSRVDEIDEIPWTLLEVGLSMAHTKNDVRGQNVFTSTRQYADGTMNKLITEAGEKNVEVYQWNIYETVKCCERECHGDPNHGDCSIFQYCQGKAHESDGFYEVDDFINKVRMLDRRTFEIEWENSLPGKQKLVYHMLGPRHRMTPERLEELTGFAAPPPHWYRIGGIDFGSSPGHPFVYLQFSQMPNGAWLLAAEYAAEQRLLKDHANAIRATGHYLPSQRIYADWGAQERLELKQYGISTVRATKGAGSVKVGIDYIGSLLSGFPPHEEPMLYIWEECTFTWGEWQKYSWPVRADGKADRSGNPEKEDDHTSDATRMALVSHKHQGPGKYKMHNVVGV